VRVLGVDAVGELVQVRLADDAVAALLQPPYRLGRPLGDVVGEEDRPVGRRQTGRVEKILDGERDPGRRRLRPREEDALELAQSSAR
jgi:hypothetical protein